MLEQLLERGASLARERVRARTERLAREMRRHLPEGATVEPDADGVRISGPGMRRRFALEAGLRWLAAGLK
jgi:hypothetical protein